MKDEEASRLRKQVKGFFRRIERELPVIEGLSQTQRHILAGLGKHPEGMRPGELAREFQMIDSNVAAALRTLETLGLVSRRGDPSDGRKILVTLTPEGAEQSKKFRKMHYAWMQRAIETHLTPDELRVLLEAGDLMQRLTNLEPGQERPAASIDAEPKVAGRRSRA